MARSNNGWLRRGLAYFKKFSGLVVLMLISRQARILSAVLFVMVSLWLLYSYAWRGLQREIELPLTVTDEEPRINIETLRSINSQWSGQNWQAQGNYASYNRFFAAPGGGDAGAARGL